MRARPRSNRRRGLIRAAIVVVLLIALLVAAMLVVSSLLAPSVNAPAAPITPGPLTPVTTPRTVLTPPPTVTGGTSIPTTPAATAPPVATPKVAPTTAKTPAKDIALGSSGPQLKVSSSTVLRQMATRPQARPATTRGWTAAFVGNGDAYEGRKLSVRQARLGNHPKIVGRADPFVQPVWSPNEESLYFVRVRQVRETPGADWTLWRWDRRSGLAHSLVSVRALGLIPLGITSGKFLYVVSRPADSIIVTLVQGRSRFLTTLISQPVSSAFLAPNGSGVAFAVPSSCSICTVDVYDLAKLWIWYGPSGAPSDLDIAWLRDGSGLVTYKGHGLVTMTNHAVVTGMFSTPARLPHRWITPMVARMAGTSVRLVDSSNGRIYVAHRSGGA